MKARHKRLSFIVAGLVGLSLVAALVLNAFQGNLVFFFSPTEVLAGKHPQDKIFRLGGLVEVGSVQRRDDGLTVHFVITDTVNSINVIYTGILPDLFSEGQGVIAQGKMGSQGTFHANEVLAKHDETYMPPEVADSLEKAKAAKAAQDALGASPETEAVPQSQP